MRLDPLTRLEIDKGSKITDISENGNSSVPEEIARLKKANEEAEKSYFELTFLPKIREKAVAESGLFQLKSANDWIKQAASQPIPRMLFSVLWHEGELCILFADTNLGKSIKAVQIADSISRGKPIPGFRMEAEAQPVLYLDFELSPKQFEKRYSKDFKSHFKFSEYLVRMEINPEAPIPDGQSFEEYLILSLERAIVNTEAKVLIVDNLTYLRTDNEKAKDALPLMKQLKSLKSKYDLSILALAHTPKRDLSKPITRNDLQGSKMLMNFCDSAFSIGENHSDPALRYIKQIKARATEIVYDSENVIVCQISKPYNFLNFEFIGFGKERDHLKQHTEQDRESLNEKVNELKQKGRSLREIGAELGISHMRVKRIMETCNTL